MSKSRKNWKKVAYDQAEVLHAFRFDVDQAERLLAAALVPESIDRAKTADALESLRHALRLDKERGIR